MFGPHCVYYIVRGYSIIKKQAETNSFFLCSIIDTKHAGLLFKYGIGNKKKMMRHLLTETIGFYWLESGNLIFLVFFRHDIMFLCSLKCRPFMIFCIDILFNIKTIISFPNCTNVFNNIVCIPANERAKPRSYLPPVRTVHESRDGGHEQLILSGGRFKPAFAERNKCKPVLLGFSLARNLVKPLFSLYGTEWRDRGYGHCRRHVCAERPLQNRFIHLCLQ